jgi:hypothetical protein
LKALKEIRFFKEINELYEATNSRHRAVWDLFDIFRLEDLKGKVVKALPPLPQGLLPRQLQKKPK